MAAYNTLRAAIDSYIKANGNKEITGTVLNDILNAMVSALGADTRFAGVAVPTTNPGNPEGNVVYFASQAGTYSNFGGIVLPLGIHILVWNGTAWTSQTWFSVDNTPTQNSQNLATSGGILQAIVDAVGVERLRAIGAEVTSCSFDGTTKKISFFNSADDTLFQLDATAFVIDGMVSDVKIEDGNLVIQFNTDAGKQDIEIPLTDIFNPANYYTKTAIDALLALYYTKTETDALLTAINNKLADGCLYRGMAEPTTNPPTPSTKVFYIATKAGTYTNFGNIAVTEGITILKYDGSNWSKEQISYSDGVFDISAYNGTSYAGLSAALGTNGANIPENLRKGGMSVKFVQSSDNKYVQYRLMSDEWSTNTEDWAIADEGVYIENPEFVYAKTDAENKILWAIKTDGGIYYGAGCPQQVKDYIEEKISSLSLDECEDIVAFLSDYLGSDTTLKVMIDGINAQIASKLDAEGLDADALGTVQAVENPEYLQATTDSENKILEAITSEGVKQINLPIETPSATIEYVENPEYQEVIKDSDGKVLFGIKINGETYIPLLEGRKEIQTEIEQLASWSDKIPPLLQRKNVPAISWIDDDFLITTQTQYYNILRNWCNTNNIKLDFAAIPSVEFTDETQTDINRVYFSEAQIQAIREYENEGFQFVVHPIHNGLYGNDVLGEGYIRKNLLLCQKAFKENCIGHSEIFVYAGASAGIPGMLKVVKELYDCAFTPDINRPNIGVERDRYHLGRCGIEISASHTVSQIKAEIDEAISKGAWIVLLTHIYNYTGDGTEATDETSMSISNLFDIISYANSKVPIVPTSEVWKERKIIWEYYK